MITGAGREFSIDFLFTLQFHDATMMSHANDAWLTFREPYPMVLEIIRARFYRRCIILGGRASPSRNNRNVAHHILLDSARVVNSRKAAVQPTRQYVRVLRCFPTWKTHELR